MNATESKSVTDSKSQSKRVEVPLEERAALTVPEFAGSFGKHPVWGYRMVYAGKVKILDGFDKMMVPQSEVKRLLSGAKAYDGKTPSCVRVRKQREKREQEAAAE